MYIQDLQRLTNSRGKRSGKKCLPPSRRDDRKVGKRCPEGSGPLVSSLYGPQDAGPGRMTGRVLGLGWAGSPRGVSEALTAGSPFPPPKTVVVALHEVGHGKNRHSGDIRQMPMLSPRYRQNGTGRAGGRCAIRRAPGGAGLCGTTGHASLHRSLTRARTAVPWSLQNWTGTSIPPPPPALGCTSQVHHEQTPEARHLRADARGQRWGLEPWSH